VGVLSVFKYGWGRALLKFTSRQDRYLVLTSVLCTRASLTILLLRASRTCVFPDHFGGRRLAGFRFLRMRQVCPGPPSPGWPSPSIRSVFAEFSAAFSFRKLNIWLKWKPRPKTFFIFPTSFSPGGSCSNCGLTLRAPPGVRSCIP